MADGSLLGVVVNNVSVMSGKYGGKYGYRYRYGYRYGYGYGYGYSYSRKPSDEGENDE